MKRVFLLLITLMFSTVASIAQQWIRINQLGYLPNDKKVAVFISTEESIGGVFSVYDASTNKPIYTAFAQRAENASKWGMKSAFRLDFSKFEKEGGYYVVFNNAKSPIFKISPNVYDGLADYLLIYLRQQRCGYNPYNDTLCHQHDGYIVDHPTRSG